MEQQIILIAAMSENRVIGKDNCLPWSIKEDMQHFKELTRGFPCIMGRRTWESLPRRPLPDRPNIIVSKTMASDVQGTMVFSTLEAALQHCAGYEKIFICGGASVYSQALAFANAIELTVIHQQYDGDAFFPEINPAEWTKTGGTDFDSFSFVSYSRNKQEMI